MLAGIYRECPGESMPNARISLWFGSAGSVSQGGRGVHPGGISLRSREALPPGLGTSAGAARYIPQDGVRARSRDEIHDPDRDGEAVAGAERRGRFANAPTEEVRSNAWMRLSSVGAIRESPVFVFYAFTRSLR